MSTTDLEAAVPGSADAPAPTNVRWCVSLWLAGMAAIAYISRTSVSVAAKDIRVSLSLSEEQLGLVMGPAFFWTYALAQIPTAWLGQRFGSRRMLVLFTAGGALAVLAFCAAGSFTALLVAWMVVGVAQAGMFPCATQTIARWHPLSERARASGLLGGSMQGGSALGIALAGTLIGAAGWRAVFALFALPGLVWAATFGVWFRNDPREHRSVNTAECALITGGPAAIKSASGTTKKNSTPWLRLMRSPTMWLICAQQFFRAGAQVFFGTWFVTYLQETRGVTLSQSAWLSVLPVIALMLAAFAGGAVSDYVLKRTGNLNTARKGVATLTLLLCTATVGAAWFVQQPVLAVLLISIGVFLAGFGAPCAYAVTIDVGGRYVPAVFSTMNMFGNFGAGLLPWVVPHFRVAIERALGGTSEATRTSWAAVLLLFASMYFAAAVCWTQLKIVPNLFDTDRPAEDGDACGSGKVG